MTDNSASQTKDDVYVRLARNFAVFAMVVGAGTLLLLLGLVPHH